MEVVRRLDFAFQAMDDDNDGAGSAEEEYEWEQIERRNIALREQRFAMERLRETGYPDRRMELIFHEMDVELSEDEYGI